MLQEKASNLKKISKGNGEQISDVIHQVQRLQPGQTITVQYADKEEADNVREILRKSIKR